MMKLPEAGITRQRRWQLKKQALGLCIICGKEEIHRGQKCLTCNIKKYGPNYKPRTLKEEWDKVDWTLTDSEIAALIDTSKRSVYQQRRKRNK